MPWFPETQTLSDPLPVQELNLRQGDRLSTYSAVIEDEYGTPIDLTDSRCYITLRGVSGQAQPKLLDHIELMIDDYDGGLVSYDWQLADTLTAVPGVYDVLIEIEYFNGDRITVPSVDQASIVTLGSSIAGDEFLLDEFGSLVPTLSGGIVRLSEMLLFEDMSYWLHEDDAYALIQPIDD